MSDSTNKFAQGNDAENRFDGIIDKVLAEHLGVLTLKTRGGVLLILTLKKSLSGGNLRGKLSVMLEV